MGSTNEDYVGRVDQIDSAELDNEFLSGKHKSKNFMSIDKCVIMSCKIYPYVNHTKFFLYPRSHYIEVGRCISSLVSELCYS